jgi:hypothetical protein
LHKCDLREQELFPILLNPKMLTGAPLLQRQQHLSQQVSTPKVVTKDGMVQREWAVSHKPRRSYRKELGAGLDAVTTSVISSLRQCLSAG